MKIFLFFLLSVLTVATYSQKAVVSDSEIYTDPQNLFSVSIPKGWATVGESSDGIQLQVSSESGTGATNYNVIVSKVKSFETLTPTGFTKWSLIDPDYFNKIAKKLLTDSVVVSKGKTLLGSKDAIYAVVEGNYSTGTLSFPIKFYILQTVFESNLYTVTFTTGKDDFEKFYPIFRGVSASFMINSTKLKPSKPKRKKRV